MLLLLAACADDPKAEPALGGAITAESGEVGELRAASAFGATSGDRAGVMVSPNPDTTCDDAAAYFGLGGEDFNPEVVSGEGVCNLYARVDGYDAAGVTLDEVDAVATLSLNCAMDTGAWAWVERSDEYDGYYYSGPWWVGSPSGYALTLSGGDGDDLALTVSMDTYTGYFPYDDESPEADPATGAVSGSVAVTWCPDIAPALN